MAGGRLWTPDEDAYLVRHYAEFGRKACASHLHRPVNGVSCRAYALGIQEVIAWTEQEDKLLIESYPSIGRSACAKLLPDRTLNAVGARAGFLMLTVNKQHAPNQAEIEVIRANYKERGGRKKCAQLLPHLKPNVISHIAENLGVLQSSRKDWTEKEIQLLRLSYANKGKNWCARQLPRRTPASIAVQARACYELGHSNLARLASISQAKTK